MNTNSYASIMLKNVAYKTYFDLTVEDYEFVFDDFIQLCKERGVMSEGPFTYAITQVDLQKRFNLDVLMPVSNSFPSDETLKFRTYFCIKTMLQGRITTDNYTESEIKVLEDLNHFAFKNKLVFSSPYYHTIKTNYDGTKSWIDIKVKVLETE